MSDNTVNAGAATRRAQRRDAVLNRQRLLDAAAEEIARRGPAVPLAEVAKAAGVGIGTFYRAFPDRTALLQALEHRSYDMLIDILERVEAAGETGARAVESYLVATMDLDYQLVLPLRGAPPLIDASAIAKRERINSLLESFLAGGRADGTVRADVNATDVIMCSAMLGQPLPHETAWFTIAHRLLVLFLDGIGASQPRPLPGPPVTRRDIETAFAAVRGE